MRKASVVMAIIILGIIAGCVTVKPTAEVETRSFDMECSSWSNVHTKCPAGGIIQKADIVTKHSKSPCDYGTSWGWYDNEIWVDKGCRATFRITVKK